MKSIIATFLLIASVSAQRPWYAGSKPIGYPELADRFQPETTTGNPQAAIGDRFGEDNNQPTPSTTTVRLPVDALGDKDLVDRISKWPVDKQPFWYINWKQIEAQRQQRPQIQDPVPAGGSPGFVRPPTQGQNQSNLSVNQQRPQGGQISDRFGQAGQVQNGQWNQERERPQQWNRDRQLYQYQYQPNQMPRDSRY